MRRLLQRSLDWRMAGLLLVAGAFGVPRMVSADVVHNDDVIITFSLGVGNDAVNGENFGFDTVRIKENNLRIHFQDTSNSGSFPSNDWRLVANDSSNGGDNYFAIEDSTAGRVPFRVDAGAPADSLRVDSGGDVGIGTANPIVELHTVDGDTPTVRLEQNGSSGFTAQTWDVAGNETNFFIRDVTNGSRLSFKIKPGAPENSFFIASDGDIGLGTASPSSGVHLRRTTGDAEVRVEASNATTAQARISLQNSTREYLLINNGNRIQWFDNTAGVEMFTVRTTSGVGRIGVNNLNPQHPIEVGTDATNGNGAHVTIAGIWTDASTRKSKKEIQDLDAEVALKAFDELKPVTYYSRNDSGEKYVGFIADDVPELVAMNDRSGIAAIEIAALVTKVVQEQKATIDAQKETIATLIKRIENLEAARPAE